MTSSPGLLVLEPLYGPDGGLALCTRCVPAACIVIMERVQKRLQAPENRNFTIVHPALHNANLSACVPGEIIVLPAAHAKVRRDGYVTSGAVVGRK